MDTASHDTMAMSMSTDEIDEAYYPGGRHHTDVLMRLGEE